MCETCTTDDMKMAYGWFADAHANAVKYEQLQKVAGRVFGAGFKVPKNYWVFRRQEIKRKIDWVNARVRKGELKRLNKLALDLLNKWTRLEDFDGRWAIWMAMQSPR